MNNLLIISATNDNNLELSNKLHYFLEELDKNNILGKHFFCTERLHDKVGFIYGS